ncbi:DUF3775 domain-containing protein [Phenylobacterium sp.]|uniref:DUF3775 domain-containing protein n=1 Tax=Phenylobacterium sp. TaxID=1871053 RepID=UPI0035B26E07
MPELDPELTLNPETAYFIVLKAREFEAKEEEVDPDDASNPTDDQDIDVLEFQADDATTEELSEAVNDLNEDERLDLIALSWIGRGDYTFDDWAAARDDARRIPRSEAARYVLQHPLFSEDLEDALNQLGYSLEDYLDGGEEADQPILGPQTD